jgi:hypothetical protein
MGKYKGNTTSRPVGRWNHDNPPVTMLDAGCLMAEETDTQRSESVQDTSRAHHTEADHLL